MCGADRNTHLKVVVVGLLGGILVGVVGITARTNNSGILSSNGRAQATGMIYRAGGDVRSVTVNTGSTIR